MNGSGPTELNHRSGWLPSKLANDDAPKIDQTAIDTITKSISHAKNLSLHLANKISFGFGSELELINADKWKVLNKDN